MTQTKAELLQTRHQGDLKLGDADSSHYVGFKAPATVGTSLVWTLPAADGTANYLLKTDGSGNLGWVADSSTDSTKMPLAGGTFTGNTIYNDNVKSIFGTGSDLQIYHDGTNTRIHNTTGDLINRTEDQFGWYSGDGSEAVAKFTVNGSCELFYNDSKKFETTAGGATITGNCSVDGLYLSDNDKAYFGTGNDLEIYHDGSNSYIKDAGTGGIYIDTSFLHVRQGSAESMINAIADGAVELYHNNVKKIETTAQAVKFIGGIAQVATAMGALEVDCNTSNYFTKTISGNSTFTFANPAASGQATAFTLELTHSSGTVTWPSSVKWNADTAPTLTTGKTHLFMFVTDDGGTRWRGSALVDYVN